MTTPAEGSWTPLNSYDSFAPVPLTDPYPGVTYPEYEETGIEPVITGIPDGNPNYPIVHLGRVIDQGSTPGTWLVRTYDGWLLDSVFPHDSYQQGDFMYLMVCGSWATDIGQRSYLPPVPPVPDYVPSGGTE
jgi:hypothetical protein